MSAALLAESPQSERSDVPERTGRNIGRDRAGGISESDGPLVQAAVEMRLSPHFQVSNQFFHNTFYYILTDFLLI